VVLVEGDNMIATGFEVGLGVMISIVFVVVFTIVSFHITTWIVDYYRDCRQKKFYYKLDKEKPTTWSKL
jgi:hypothetical protein